MTQTPDASPAEETKGTGIMASVFGFGRKKEDRKQKQKDHEKRLEEMQMQQRAPAAMPMLGVAAGGEDTNNSPGKDGSWSIADAEVGSGERAHLCL